MFPNQKESIFLILALIVVEYGIAGYLGRAGVYWEAGDARMYIVIVSIATALILYYSMHRTGLKINEVFHAGFNNVAALLVLASLPIVIATLAIHVLLSNIINIQFHYLGQTQLTESILKMMSAGAFGFISVCIVAPVSEELIFRGIILRGLLSRYSTSKAIFVSSSLFSLFHINPDQLIAALAVGFFLGWLYVKSYSLWPSIVAHMSFNIWAYIMEHTSVKILGFNYFPNDEIHFVSASLQFLSIIMLIASYAVMSFVFRLRFKS